MYQVINYLNTLATDHDLDIDCIMRVLANNELAITRQLPCNVTAPQIDLDAKNATLASLDDMLKGVLAKKASIRTA
jgi:hypothetical protein